MYARQERLITLHELKKMVAINKVGMGVSDGFLPFLTPDYVTPCIYQTYTNNVVTVLSTQFNVLINISVYATATKKNTPDFVHTYI